MYIDTREIKSFDLKFCLLVVGESYAKKRSFHIPEFNLTKFLFSACGSDSKIFA